MRLLIDGDSPIYRAAFAAQQNWYYVYVKGEEEMGYCARFKRKKEALEYIDKDVEDFIIETEIEVESEYAAIHNIEAIMGALISNAGGGDYTVYVGGDGNFRYDINPEYKAGRPPRPVHYDIVKKYLIERYAAEVVDGMEVDDKVSMEQWKAYDPMDDVEHRDASTMIVTIDKDLDMVPGYHYNWIKQEKYFITGEEGERNFYTQLLTGDRTDNIHGLVGVGPKTAATLLEGATTSQELFEVCKTAYKSAGRDDIETVARQIWMSKNEPNDWEVPE